MPAIATPQSSIQWCARIGLATTDARGWRLRRDRRSIARHGIPNASASFIRSLDPARLHGGAGLNQWRQRMYHNYCQRESGALLVAHGTNKTCPELWIPEALGSSGRPVGLPQALPCWLENSEVPHRSGEDAQTPLQRSQEPESEQPQAARDALRRGNCRVPPQSVRE